MSDSPGGDSVPEIVGAFPPTADDLRWDARSRDELYRALPRIRATAEKWELRLSVILSLFGSALLVGGRSAITDIDVHYAVVAAILATLGLGAALGSLMKAALAAEGTPSEIFVTGQTLRTSYLNDSKAAAGHLICSRWLAALFVALAAASLGVASFAPPRGGLSDNVVVITGQGPTRCGRVHKFIGSDLELASQSHATQTVHVSDMVAIIPVKECPDGTSG